MTINSFCSFFDTGGNLLPRSSTYHRIFLYLLNLVFERSGLRDSGGGPEETEETEESFSLETVTSMLSPMNFLSTLGLMHPLLDYRRYFYARKFVNYCRRAYAAALGPLTSMWDGPEVLYNVTVHGTSAFFSDPDTHEFRLLKETEKKVRLAVTKV